MENKQKIECVRFTKKLVNQLAEIADCAKCDRIAVLNPYTMKVIRVIDKDGSVYKPSDYSKPTFIPNDEYFQWETKDLIWGKGYNKPIVTNVEESEYMSLCPPMNRKDGELKTHYVRSTCC